MAKTRTLPAPQNPSDPPGAEAERHGRRSDGEASKSGDLRASFTSKLLRGPGAVRFPCDLRALAALSGILRHWLEAFRAQAFLGSIEGGNLGTSRNQAACPSDRRYFCASSLIKEGLV